jgi:hypothetical protein
MKKVAGVRLVCVVESEGWEDKDAVDLVVRGDE